MFKSDQIMSGTHLVRNFRNISWHLTTAPQALLITLRKGDPLVLVNAEIFEELLSARLKNDLECEQNGHPNSAFKTPSA
ncbi:MAG: hypothetical protein K1X83_14470 [Oligoflexia bacterium]|nr:hypothetical protein [Oligoflexia bacterium]